jgi:predicted MFS family arabinose efflux permease
MVVGLVSAVFSFLAFLLSLFFLPESMKKNPDRALPRKLFDYKNLFRILKSPSLGLLIIMFFVLTFSVANIYGTFALLGYKLYHMNDLQIGMVFGFMGLISAIVQGSLINKFSKKFSDNQIISAGAFFTMIGLGLIPFGGNLLGVYLVCILLNFGTAILQPTLLAMISKISSENEQGIILGTNQSLSAFARMLGPLWGGFAFEYLGYQIPFLTGALFTFFIFLFSIFYFSKHINVPKSPL